MVVRAEASGYFSHTQPVEVRAGEDARPTVQINKRPKTASVKVQGNEIGSRSRSIETDSAKIVGDSNSLLEEIADVLQRHQGIKKVEIQGHTDNSGTREHNQQPGRRARPVGEGVARRRGVESSRLTAKGFGQDRPLAPNVTGGQPRQEPPRAVHHPRRQVSLPRGSPRAPSRPLPARRSTSTGRLPSLRART